MTQPDEAPAYSPQCSRQAIRNCQFSAWHTRYRRHVPRARIIAPLSRSFVDYLLADGIVLPSDDEGAEVEALNQVRQEHSQLVQVIQELNGAVIPKLNWSAPRDAVWMIPGNTMKCTSADDVYLLLKSSDFIVHDLTHMFDDCIENDGDTNDVEFELVLKEWFDVQPSMEFRCFVYDRKLVAISQRDSNFYAYLYDMRDEIVSQVLSLTDEMVDDFPDPHFVVDVYIQRTRSRTWLIDVNPWAVRTDTLLFTWDEIHLLAQRTLDEPELRLVPRDATGNTASAAMSANKVPLDAVYASQGHNVAEFAQTWEQMLARGVHDTIAPSDSDDDGS